MQNSSILSSSSFVASVFSVRPSFSQVRLLHQLVSVLPVHALPELLQYGMDCSYMLKHKGKFTHCHNSCIISSTSNLQKKNPQKWDGSISSLGKWQFYSKAEALIHIIQCWNIYSTSKVTIHCALPSSVVLTMSYMAKGNKRLESSRFFSILLYSSSIFVSGRHVKWFGCNWMYKVLKEIHNIQMCTAYSFYRHSV